jgi:hypothetical protein
MAGALQDTVCHVTATSDTPNELCTPAAHAQWHLTYLSLHMQPSIIHADSVLARTEQGRVDTAILAAKHLLRRSVTGGTHGVLWIRNKQTLPIRNETVPRSSGRCDRSRVLHAPRYSPAQ